MALQEGLCLFGMASGPDGVAFRYKILGLEAPASRYELVLEVTNVLASYIAKFSLQSLLTAAENSSVIPDPEQMLGWLQQRFEDEVVEAVVDAGGGLQLVAVHAISDLKVTISLPPEGPMAPLPEQSRAWVAQEVLFSTGEQLRETKRNLEACEQRCPPSQQLEDIITFLSVSRGQADGGAGGGSPAAPRVSLFKRKQPEPEVATAMGSAIKSARQDGVAGAVAAATGQPPVSTQQTGGMSSQARKTEVSVGQPKRIAGTKPVPGWGRRAKLSPMRACRGQK